MLSRVFGVPHAHEEQNRLSQYYLARRIDQLKRQGVVGTDELLTEAAKQAIVNDLDQYLHQIAARSQTLLAVIALLIGMFASISKSNSIIKPACVLWAMISLTLFYNIWLFFGQTENYKDTAKEYDETIDLNYRRSALFNANIIYSVLFALFCSFAYLWEAA